MKENLRYKYENNELKIYTNNEWKKIIFDGYEFIDKIGDGANGVVLKAKHIITERIDAIKIWLPHKKSTDGTVSEKQYLNEIRKISNLKNSNIVTIYDARIINNEIYMASMEYIEGVSLDKWIEKNSYKLKRIEICEKILNTILEYQNIGIIHGDLHGGNILIDYSDNVHIIDFGTSLFGKNNQSKEREAYFIVDLVKKLMGEDFKENCFKFKNYKLSGKILKNNDSRNFEPILITKTLINYNNLYRIKEQAHKLDEKSVLAEYCCSIAEGIYFDLENIFQETMKWNNNSLGLNLYIFIDESMYDAMFTKYLNDTEKAEEVYYSTLYIYYEEFKQIHDKVDYQLAEEYYLEYNKGISRDNYLNSLENLKKYINKSYIDYHNVMIDEGRKISNETNRSILYSILESYYGNEIILEKYKIWQKLNELWLNEELLKQIYELMNIAKKKR